jgi:small conductance mechanosensitive channel
MRYSHDRRCCAVSAFVLLAAFVIALSIAPNAPAQDEPAAWEVSIEALELDLKPMRLAALEEEAERWMGLLEAKVAELKDVEKAALTAEAEAQQALLEQAATLRDERTALLDRVKVVVDKLKAKGGAEETIKEYDLYFAEVSGVTVDVTDASAAWTTIRTWLQSKEGGIRWAKNIGSFIVILILTWILGRLLGGIVRKAVSRVKKTSELLRKFLVNTTRKGSL